ncbi:uncharacterized protein LOC110461760 [Mizuhopecten yessoensis]|uniref:uncharacterized protein LOC110461760 n=1 Tax=Mizuhopecten yessoensis TaxID=6573 RepID=UPI000B45C756|nr:uncharacterized protein LOC110461760 [Mizuhopecten yessoensis]
MNSKINVDRSSSRNDKVEYRGSNEHVSVANNTEMLDPQGHRTGICIHNAVNRYHVNKQQEQYLKSTREEDSGEQTEDLKHLKENAVYHKVNTDFGNKELNSFGETMLKSFPGGEVEMLEGNFNNETSDMSMIIAVKKQAQASQNNDIEHLVKSETELGSMTVDRSKTCCKADGSDVNAGRTRRLAMLENVSLSSKGLKNLCKFFSFWILLNPPGASGARINPLVPGNNDMNYQQMLRDYWYAIAFLGAFALHHGRPLCNVLRNLLGNCRNFRRHGYIMLVPQANAIIPGRGRRVVGRALPPRYDGIRVLQPERRANQLVRMYHPRNQAGDNRVLRVFEERVVQVAEETIQATGPSEIVPSAHGS